MKRTLPVGGDRGVHHPVVNPSKPLDLERVGRIPKGQNKTKQNKTEEFRDEIYIFLFSDTVSGVVPRTCAPERDRNPSQTFHITKN